MQFISPLPIRLRPTLLGSLSAFTVRSTNRVGDERTTALLSQQFSELLLGFFKPRAFRRLGHVEESVGSELGRGRENLLRRQNLATRQNLSPLGADLGDDVPGDLLTVFGVVLLVDA